MAHDDLRCLVLGRSTPDPLQANLQPTKLDRLLQSCLHTD
jgi:hypothetical protein